jgi:hypothetical protein
MAGTCSWVNAICTDLWTAKQLETGRAEGGAKIVSPCVDARPLRVGDNGLILQPS